MHYDAAGEAGWLVALAVSNDLEHWTKLGTVLELGSDGSRDSASSSYGTTYFDGHSWHMFYLGTPHATQAPIEFRAFHISVLKLTRSHPPVHG